MTVIQKGWTLRFHAIGTTTPSAGTKDFDVTEFAEPPVFGGQVVDPSRGTAATIAYRFVVPDLSAILTGNLANASTGRTDLIGRLVELLEATDGGSATRVFVGRCSALTEPVPGRWTIEVSDERFQERTASVFSQVGDTVQLYPPGPRYAFRYFPAIAETAKARVAATASGNRKKLVVSSPWEFTPEVLDWIQRDVIEEPEPDRDDGSGNFTHLRVEVNGVTLEVAKFGDLDASSVTDRLEDTDPKAGHNIPVWVVDSGSDLGAVGTTYTDAAFIAPTAPPSPVLPLLLGVESSSQTWGYDTLETSVFYLVEKLYTAAGVRFDATRFGALQVAGYPKMAWRITAEVRDLAQWLDTSVYGPLGIVPFTNTQGEISPRSTRLPDPSTFDVNSAFAFDADNLTSPPSYDQNARDLINVLRVRSERMNLVWRGGGVAGQNIASNAEPIRIGSGPADRIFSTVSEDLVTHDNIATVGRREAAFDLSGFPPAGEGRDTGGFLVRIKGFEVSGGSSLDSAKRLLARELFERWGDGPIRWSFNSFRSGGAENVVPGDFVVLDVATLPNPASNSRGGQRVVQILAKRPSVQGIAWEAIDAGPALQPLSAPITSIAQGTDTKHSVSVTVSGLAAGTTATVEVALGSSAPFTKFFDGKGNGSFTVKGLPSGTTIRARARATAPNRTRSSYSSIVSVATDALTAPTVSTPTVNGWAMDVEFTNNETGYQVMPVSRPASTGSFVADLRTPLPAASTFYTFRFAAGSTSYDVGFKVVDPYGGESAVGSQTASTDANANQLAEPTRVQVTQGRPAGLDPDLPPAELWTGTGLEIGFIPTELHADTIVQMASVSNFSVVDLEVVVSPGETRVQLYTPGLDKTLRYVRLFHRARGNDDSDYSAVVSALPTALLGNQPPDQFAGGYFQLVERDDGTLGAVAGTGGDISTDRIYYAVAKNPADPDAVLTVDENSDYLSLTGASPATGSLPFSGQFPPDSPLAATFGDTFVARARFWNAKAGFGQETVDRLSLVAPDAFDVLAIHTEQFPITYGPPPQTDIGDYEVYARCDVGSLVLSVKYTFTREEQFGSQIVSNVTTNTMNQLVDIGGIDFAENSASLTVTPYSAINGGGTAGTPKTVLFWSKGASPEGVLAATGGDGSIVTRPELDLPDAAFDWATTSKGVGPTTRASRALAGTTGSQAVDRSLGGSFRVTATGNITLTASNFGDGQVAVLFAKMGANELTLSGMTGPSGSPWTGDCIVWIGRDNGTTWASVLDEMVAY